MKFVFIRFNPDSFTNNLGIKKEPNMKIRMEYLKDEINKQIKRINKEKNKELLDIKYLFYFNYHFIINTNN